MKKILIANFIIFFVTFHALGQSACSNAKVISPVVSKPTAGSIVSATCSNLVVQWQGAANQSYTANISSYNTTTNKWDTAYATGTCNSSQMCTATLLVSAGTKVSWSVQAVQVVNGRTFYSYYLIGERDYPIPACSQAITKTEQRNNNVPELPVLKEQLLVYPNPATNEVTIQWSSGYKGAAVVVLNDAAGKEIRVQRVSKEGEVYTSRITVSNLVAGLYYLQVKPQNGQPLTGRFLKQ